MTEIKELTIAQALRRIKDIKGRVAKHGHNAQASVTHRADNSPAYVFSAEWEKATALVDEMIDLQTRVSIANSRAMVDWEGKTRTLTWCTKKLAEIKGAIAWHEGLTVRAQEKTTEETYEWAQAQNARARVVVEYTCHLPEQKRDERVRALQDKFNELNDVVERMNHRTEV